MALSVAGDLQKLIRVAGAAPGFIPHTPELTGPVYLNNQTMTDVAQAKAALPNATVYNLTADQYAQLQVNFRNAQRNNHGFWNDFVIHVLPMFASVAIPALGQYGAAAAAGTAAASAAAAPSLASIIGSFAPYIGTALRAGLTRDANAIRLGLSAPSLAEPSSLTDQLSSTGGFDPFGLDDQVFVGSLAAAADAPPAGPPSLLSDAVIVPFALLLLGLTWWYVRKK